MGTNHVESRFSQRFSSYLEGIDGGIVLGDKKLVAGLYRA